MKNKIKVAWLAPYPITKIPNIELIGKLNFHPAPWLVNLAEALAQKDELELHIVTENPKLKCDKYILHNNVSFHFLKSAIPFTHRGYPSFFPFSRLTFYYFNSKRINKLLSNLKPDIVHAHGTETSYAISALRSNFKSIISIQGIISEISKFDKHFSSHIQKNIEQYVTRRAKNFACRTNFDKSFVLKINSQARIFHLNEAVNPIFFQEKWKDPNNSNLLFVGTISESKGVNILIYAIAIIKSKIPNIHLSLIGNGSVEFRLKMENFIKVNNLEHNIEFMGSQPPEVVRKKLLGAQIFILPTLIDNSPNSLAEAMVVGTPCIASDVGGIPSLIKDGVEGILVEPNKVESLAEKVITLLNDSKKREKLSNNARFTALKRHLPHDVASKTLEVYRTLITKYY